MRKKRVNFNTITIEFGEYDFDETYVHDNIIYKTKPKKVISELEFYKKYLLLKTLIKTVRVDGEEIDVSITPMCIELMAHIMTKGLDFNMNWKNDCQQLKDLAKEMGRTEKSLYKSYVMLKKKRYFITTEDKLVMPNMELHKLRKRVKDLIAKNEHAAIDVNLEFCIG